MFMYDHKDLRKRLQIERKFLELNVEGFPKRRCHLAAEFLKRIEGFEVVVGIYVPPGIRINSEGSIEYHPDFYLCQGHSWNKYVERNVYVDITHDQFTKQKRDTVKILNWNTNSLRALSDGWVYHLVTKSDPVFANTLNDLVEKFEKINNK
ncbi:MAG: hypothetical protein ACP5N2_03010 [Candidatus Nanoarchaeia archaeon]